MKLYLKKKFKKFKSQVKLKLTEIVFKKNSTIDF